MYITSYLMGGLGNQMFQISKAYSEGIKNNISVLFRKNAFIPMEGNQPTKYLDNIFRKIIFVDDLNPSKRINEMTWSYYDQNYVYNEPTEFYGYFQSSKNFLNYKNDIKNLFKPTEEFIKKINNIFPKLTEKNSMSLHVRRGDYTTISEILPVMDKSYFDHCVNNVDYSNLFIFSNDKDWVYKNLNYKNSVVVDGLEDYEELWAISLCKYNIMSNSSFSWWGSYLNNNIDKKIFVPSVWFGPKGEHNYNSIYEEEWSKIDVTFKDNKLIYLK